MALLLDLLCGDPRWLPHPVKLIGRLAGAVEGLFRKIISFQKAAGILAVLGVLLITGLVVTAILALAAQAPPLVEGMIAVFLLYTTIAVRDLINHSLEVHAALVHNNLGRAREAVGKIVGRDTADLDSEGVARACVESVAENLVDGITAPLFYAVLGGPLGAVLYKAINTMDSMFGYKNERYEKFGWAAARLDDLANFIPARLTGLLVILAALLLNLRPAEAWKIFWRDRRQHASPNAGHPEAAVAGALGLQFGGLNYYFGAPVRKPTIGDPLLPVGQQHILQVNRIALTVTGLATALLLTGRVFLAWS